MRAELRDLFASDADDLATWRPPGDAFAVTLRLVVGPDDGPGEETFDVTVCSPDWLAEQVTRTPVLDARHHVVVAAFDWATIRRYVEDRVVRCSGDSWGEVAQQLSRLASWEFEDYRPAR